MQAIQTKFLAPTNSKPARIKASCAAGSITIDCDNLECARHEEDRHQLAAAMLQQKLGWDSETYGKLATGGLSDGTYVHVFTGSK